MNKSLLSILVLEYKKPTETKLCLESLRRHVKIPHTIVLLDNGGKSDYCWEYYRAGLCDVLISKEVGGGGGEGQTDLFRWSTSEYSILVQNDQILQYDIDENIFNQFAGYLNNGYHCIDLNGDQSNRGVWTDRAHMIKTEFFNGLGPFPNGGPGENHHLPWNEKYLQDKFAENGYRIAHIKPALFADNGVWSIRQLPAPCNGLSKHRTDTKELHWLNPPEAKYIFPNLTDEEWARSISGQWINGSVPEKEKAHSFKCWPD